MKNLFTPFILCLVFTFSFGQNTEFEIHSNGLIYNQKTIGQLQCIVDSLDLQFRNCDLNKIHYAKLQAKGHYVKLKEGNIKGAQKDFENNISLGDFLKKYPKAKIERDLLIVKFQYKNIDNIDIINYSKISLEEGKEYEIYIEGKPELYNKKLKNKWIFEYSEGYGGYASASISGFFFTTEFEKKAIPENYARMIQYADCMIDTTATKLMENADYGNINLPLNHSELPHKEKLELLDNLRCTKVMGYCSMDIRPRVHAMNIAQLAAETTHWEVFLRAHFDIMNDRFDRVSDGSYAWEARKTYIKELEELNINVADLIIGITFRMENPSENHYYGDIERLGRALSETEYKEKIVAQMLSMIEDKKLDDFNRVLICRLFLSYSYYIENEVEQKFNIGKLKKAVTTLPNYLSSKIAFEE